MDYYVYDQYHGLLRDFVEEAERRLKETEEHTTQGTCDMCRKDSSGCEPLPGPAHDDVLICENCREEYGEFMAALEDVPDRPSSEW
jgi:predicted PolB exonuclease-like 3'-5' exonuclease